MRRNCRLLQFNMPTLKQLQTEWKKQNFSKKKIAMLTKRHSGKQPKASTSTRPKNPSLKLKQVVQTVVQNSEGKVFVEVPLTAKMMEVLKRRAINFDKWRLKSLHVRWITALGALKGGSIGLIDRDWETV